MNVHLNDMHKFSYAVDIKKAHSSMGAIWNLRDAGYITGSEQEGCIMVPGTELVSFGIPACAVDLENRQELENPGTPIIKNAEAYLMLVSGGNGQSPGCMHIYEGSLLRGLDKLPCGEDLYLYPIEVEENGKILCCLEQIHGTTIGLIFIIALTEEWEAMLFNAGADTVEEWIKGFKMTESYTVYDLAEPHFMERKKAGAIMLNLIGFGWNMPHFLKVSIGPEEDENFRIYSLYGLGDTPCLEEIKALLDFFEIDEATRILINLDIGEEYFVPTLISMNALTLENLSNKIAENKEAIEYADSFIDMIKEIVSEKGETDGRDY